MRSWFKDVIIVDSMRSLVFANIILRISCSQAQSVPCQKRSSTSCPDLHPSPLLNESPISVVRIPWNRKEMTFVNLVRHLLHWSLNYRLPSDHHLFRSVVDTQTYPACSNSISLAEELLSIFDRLRTSEQNLKQREEDAQRMIRETESLNKQFQQSKSESRYLKEENKRLVEETRSCRSNLMHLKDDLLRMGRFCRGTLRWSKLQ